MPDPCPSPGDRLEGLLQVEKIMRRLLRDIAEDREPGDVTTLRDPSIPAQLQHDARAGRR